MHAPTTGSPRLRRSTATFVAVALVVSACGSSDDPPTATAGARSSVVDTTAAPATTEPGDATPTTDVIAETTTPSDADDASPAVAPDDYTVDLGGGLRLEIPAGERADVTADVTTGSLSDGSVTVSMQPDGATFETPVRLFVDIESATSDGLVATGASLTSADGSVENLEPELDDETIVFPIAHFSDVTVVSLRVGDVLVPGGPLAVGEEVAMEFGPAEVATDGITAAEAAAVIAGIEAIGGWDAAFSNDESVAVIDTTAPTVRCVDDGGGSLYLGAVIVIDGRKWVYNGHPEIDCEAAPARTSVTAADVTATQFHDTGALPAGLLDLGALSAIIVAISAASDGEVFLISDANRSGTIDAGDWIPFPAQPIGPDGQAVAPIDAGGPYFIGIVHDGSQAPDSLVGVPFDDPIEQDGLWVFAPSATEGTSVVVRSLDDPTPVFYDVDFGEPVMNAMP